MEYGCGVRNRYELFADEDGSDPLELIQREEERRRLSQAERNKHKSVDGAKQTTTSQKAASPANNNRVSSKENSNKANQHTEGARSRENRTHPDHRKSRDNNLNLNTSSHNNNNITNNTANNTDGGRSHPAEERRHRKITQDGNQENRRPSGRDIRGPRPTRGPRREGGADRDAKDKERAPRGDRTHPHSQSGHTATAPIPATITTPTPNKASADSAGQTATTNAKTDGQSAEPPQPEASPADESNATEPQEQTEKPAADAKEENETVEGAEVEPETPEKTLDQWKKEMEARKSKTTYNAAIRKPNEGEGSDPKWAKMKVIKKKKEPEGPAHVSIHKEPHHPVAEEALDEEDRKLKRLEETVSKQFHFLDSRGNASGSLAGGRSNRGARGGSFGGRGGGARGSRGGGGGSGGGIRNSSTAAGGGETRAPGAGSRGYSHNGGHSNAQQPQSRPTPRVEDLNDFPSLAA